MKIGKICLKYNCALICLREPFIFDTMIDMKVLNYTVIIHPAEEGGYWAEVPALKGCFTQGETIEEITAMAKEAIEGYIASLAKDGIRAPVEKKLRKPRTFSVPVSVRVRQTA
mgnify:CR=1 FL=1